MSVEPMRRVELVEAAIHEIGSAGSLNVTVGQIAKRAGVSPALAFHYFGDKERLFLAAMRHIMGVYGAEVRSALAAAQDRRQRLEAIVLASFGPSNFRRDAISAWLNFYVLAQSSPEAARLLRIYRRRLQSNLAHDLRPMVGSRAGDVARRIGGLIDGLYLRSALSGEEGTAEDAAALALGALAVELDRGQAPR